MKKIIIILSFIISPAFALFGDIETSITPIDAQKNAQLHNNLGVNYVRERDYVAAIKEFYIAIGINPRTQATAVYYNNLGGVYVQVGHYAMAQECFETALIQDCMSFEYYKNLANVIHLQGKTNAQITRYKNLSNNPYDEIMVGLLYEKAGNLELALKHLNEFCIKEPNLVITDALKSYMKGIVERL